VREEGKHIFTHPIDEIEIKGGALRNSANLLV
jgi:hypothetical protein